MGPFLTSKLDRGGPVLTLASKIVTSVPLSPQISSQSIVEMEERIDAKGDREYHCDSDAGGSSNNARDDYDYAVVDAQPSGSEIEVKTRALVIQ